MGYTATGARGDVLLVDDDPFNIELMQAYLANTGFHCITASSGEEAWQKINDTGAAFETILLDRMMPTLDGLELLIRIKATPHLRDVPVIMQTAANERQQVAEGIKHGAYYYLTKPYSREVLVAIVEAAVADYANQRALRAGLSKEQTGRSFLVRADFVCRRMAETKLLAAYIASFFPKPESAVLGIAEMLLNAHEHGNLGIGYQEKGRLMKRYAWLPEVERREALPENAHKEVRATLERSDDRLVLTVRDQGAGFDPTPYLGFDTDRAFEAHGRGIAMARMLTFDELEYLGCGNEVRLTTLL